MADLKISALTASTTPLAGTEVLPIVQSSTTKQVSVANLTAGRAVAVGSLSSTGTITRGTFGSTGRAATLNGASVLLEGAGAFDLLMGDGGTAYFSLSTPATTTTFKIRDSTGNADLVTVTRSSGDTTVNKGNLVQGTAAKGINFTANTPAASMTSQLLNWYEEGTWTPTDGSGAGLTFVSATGRYTRVGRLVTVQLSVVYPITLNGATATMSGLPFAASGAYAGACMTNKVSAATYIANGATAVNLYDLNGLNDYKNSAVSNGTIIGTITYFV